MPDVLPAAPTFRFAWMTPEGVAATHPRFRTAFIEMCGPYAIYLLQYEHRQSFSVAGMGALPVVDQQSIDAELARLEAVVERGYDLEMELAHNESIIRQFQPTVDHFAQPLPEPVSAPLAYEDIARDAFIHIGRSRYVSYDAATDTLWMKGRTGMSLDADAPFNLKQLREELEAALLVERERQGLGLHTAGAIKAHFEVPLKSDGVFERV